MERILLEYLVNSAWQVPLLAAAAWLGVRVGRGSAQFQHGGVDCGAGGGGAASGGSGAAAGGSGWVGRDDWGFFGEGFG